MTNDCLRTPSYRRPFRATPVLAGIAAASMSLTFELQLTTEILQRDHSDPPLPGIADPSKRKPVRLPGLGTLPEPDWPATASKTAPAPNIQSCGNAHPSSSMPRND